MEKKKKKNSFLLQSYFKRSLNSTDNNNNYNNYNNNNNDINSNNYPYDENSLVKLTNEYNIRSDNGKKLFCKSPLGLVAYYRCTEGTSQILSDTSGCNRLAYIKNYDQSDHVWYYQFERDELIINKDHRGKQLKGNHCIKLSGKSNCYIEIESDSCLELLGGNYSMNEKSIHIKKEIFKNLTNDNNEGFTFEMWIGINESLFDRKGEKKKKKSKKKKKYVQSSEDENEEYNSYINSKGNKKKCICLIQKGKSCEWNIFLVIDNEKEECFFVINFKDKKYQFDTFPISHLKSILIKKHYWVNISIIFNLTIDLIYVILSGDDNYFLRVIKNSYLIFYNNLLYPTNFFIDNNKQLPLCIGIQPEDGNEMNIIEEKGYNFSSDRGKKKDAKTFTGLEKEKKRYNNNYVYISFLITEIRLYVSSRSADMVMKEKKSALMGDFAYGEMGYRKEKKKKKKYNTNSDKDESEGYDYDDDNDNNNNNNNSDESYHHSDNNINNNYSSNSDNQNKNLHLKKKKYENNNTQVKYKGLKKPLVINSSDENSESDVMKDVFDKNGKEEFSRSLEKQKKRVKNNIYISNEKKKDDEEDIFFKYSNDIGGEKKNIADRCSEFNIEIEEMKKRFSKFSDEMKGKERKKNYKKEEKRKVNNNNSDNNNDNYNNNNNNNNNNDNKDFFQFDMENSNDFTPHFSSSKGLEEKDFRKSCDDDFFVGNKKEKQKGESKVDYIMSKGNKKKHDVNVSSDSSSEVGEIKNKNKRNNINVKKNKGNDDIINNNNFVNFDEINPNGSFYFHFSDGKDESGDEENENNDDLYFGKGKERNMKNDVFSNNKKEEKQLEEKGSNLLLDDREKGDIIICNNEEDDINKNYNKEKYINFIVNEFKDKFEHEFIDKFVDTIASKLNLSGKEKMDIVENIKNRGKEKTELTYKGIDKTQQYQNDLSLNLFLGDEKKNNNYDIDIVKEKYNELMKKKEFSEQKSFYNEIKEELKRVKQKTVIEKEMDDYIKQNQLMNEYYCKKYKHYDSDKSSEDNIGDNNVKKGYLNEEDYRYVREDSGVDNKIEKDNYNKCDKVGDELHLNWDNKKIIHVTPNEYDETDGYVDNIYSDGSNSVVNIKYEKKSDVSDFTFNKYKTVRDEEKKKKKKSKKKKKKVDEKDNDDDDDDNDDDDDDNDDDDDDNDDDDDDNDDDDDDNDDDDDDDDKSKFEEVQGKNVYKKKERKYTHKDVLPCSENDSSIIYHKDEIVSEYGNAIISKEDDHYQRGCYDETYDKMKKEEEMNIGKKYYKYICPLTPYEIYIIEKFYKHGIKEELKEFRNKNYMSCNNKNIMNNNMSRNPINITYIKYKICLMKSFLNISLKYIQEKKYTKALKVCIRNSEYIKNFVRSYCILKYKKLKDNHKYIDIYLNLDSSEITMDELKNVLKTNVRNITICKILLMINEYKHYRYIENSSLILILYSILCRIIVNTKLLQYVLKKFIKSLFVRGCLFYVQKMCEFYFLLFPYENKAKYESFTIINRKKKENEQHNNKMLLNQIYELSKNNFLIYSTCYKSHKFAQINNYQFNFEKCISYFSPEWGYYIYTTSNFNIFSSTVKFNGFLKSSSVDFSLISEEKYESLFDDPSMVIQYDVNNDEENIFGLGSTILKRGGPEGVSRSVPCCVGDELSIENNKNNKINCDDKIINCDDNKINCDDKIINCDDNKINCDDNKINCGDNKINCDDNKINCEDNKINYDDKIINCDDNKINCDDNKINCDDNKINCDDNKINCDDNKINCDDNNLECDYFNLENRNDSIVLHGSSNTEEGNNKLLSSEPINSNEIKSAVEDILAKNDCLHEYLLNYEKKKRNYYIIDENLKRIQFSRNKTNYHLETFYELTNDDKNNENYNRRNKLEDNVMSKINREAYLNSSKYAYKNTQLLGSCPYCKHAFNFFTRTCNICQRYVHICYYLFIYCTYKYHCELCDATYSEKCLDKFKNGFTCFYCGLFFIKK
ncbi:conserved Plasmodium protein, unknown function [Plasmodium sp. gorilla clade G3]|nr:conserved Plasmodium protein, unknown function [Plasmodium sp. gorilla clade G3]